MNKQAMRERMSALRSARALNILPPRNANPEPKVLVIRVRFSNKDMAASIDQTRALFQEIRDYYTENSYGTFRPTFTVTSMLYSLPGTEAYYGADCGDDVTCHLDRFFTASTSAAASESFASYDQLMLYHAGQGQETQPINTNTDYLWSLYMDENRAAEGKTFTGYTVVPEAEGGGIDPHGVICHEYGHQLGLPDLYDTTPPGHSTVGKWDVMDYPYGATAAETPHLGAWSKYYMGFSNPSAAPGTVVLAPASSHQTAFLRLAHPSANESFLLEFRWRNDLAAVFDKGAPAAGGLALWHVDDSMVAEGGAIMDNNVLNAPSLNGRGHRGVDLIEADGFEGEASDHGAGDLFRDGTSASLDRTASFGGQPSGITIAVVSGSDGPALTVNVVSFSAAPTLSISRVINYPNPAGNTSRYPVRAGAPPGTVTTLVLQLTKPLPSNGDIHFDLYDLNGERVRAVAGTAFDLKVGAGEPTADGKWVYECDWDGRDDNGRDLPGGVYFYRVKLEGETKTGKLMIVR